jgi:adenylate cyclase
MERYLPPQLIGEFYKQNVNLEPGGRNQVVTILFSDIRSFTTISESLEAAEVVALLNEYLSSMTDIIFENQGTIDKFIGDAIMTIFGAPIQGTDDAIRAVKTAIFMKLALKEFNQKHPELKLPIEIGIGIHTGEVIAGNIGSEKRLDYTVIGDNVNLSSRIEGLTSHYKCPILVSESTYQAVSLENDESLFCFREVDKVRVKGKTKNIHVYEVMFYSNQEEKKKIHEIKNIFEFGLRLYRERKYQEAKSEWMKLPQDPLSAIYLERCDQYIASPPDDSWDGSFIMPTK